jgi:hypothetical protein
MKKCLSCSKCKEKEGEKQNHYFCNEQGMVATEELLPEECDRFMEKKNEEGKDV